MEKSHETLQGTKCFFYNVNILLRDNYMEKCYQQRGNRKFLLKNKPVRCIYKIETIILILVYKNSKSFEFFSYIKFYNEAKIFISPKFIFAKTILRQ